MDKIFLYLFTLGLFAFVGSTIMFVKSFFKNDGKTKKYGTIAVVSFITIFISMAFINSGFN